MMVFGLSGIFIDNECTQLTAGKQHGDNSLVGNNNRKNIVKGLGFSGQIVIGTARIVQSRQDFHKVCSGDILVAKTTNDEWLSVMKRSAGIITDNGDSNSHAALFSKKNAIPVLVGAGDATEKMKDGDLITLDCTHNLFGYVYSAKKKGTVYSPVMSSVPSVGDSCSARASATQTLGGVIAGENNRVSENNNVAILPVSNATTSDACNAQYHKELSSTAFITREKVSKIYSDFVGYVLSNQSWLNATRKAPFSNFAISTAARVKGYDPFAIDCIPLSFSFFDQSKTYIEEIIKDLLLDHNIAYMNLLCEKCEHSANKLKNFRNAVARIAHEQHVSTIGLPEAIQREALKSDPKKYQKIMEQKVVDQKECHIRIAAGMFVDYWFFEKHV